MEALLPLQFCLIVLYEFVPEANTFSYKISHIGQSRRGKKINNRYRKQESFLFSTGRMALLFSIGRWKTRAMTD